jgi:hypothetical protein
MARRRTRSRDKETGIAGARVRVEELPKRIACMCACTHEDGNIACIAPVHACAYMHGRVEILHQYVGGCGCARARVRVEITVSKKGRELQGRMPVRSSSYEDGSGQAAVASSARTPAARP